jgi:hypothetical protein
VWGIEGQDPLLFDGDGRRLSPADTTNIPLDPGTRLVTGGDGHVQMKLPDGTLFTVGPNSDFIIDEFIYDPNNSPEKIAAKLIKGVFRWVTGKVTRKAPPQMKVMLRNVTVGIRGTDFEAMVAPDGSGAVKLYSGQLNITEQKTQRTVLLNAGQMLTFSNDGVFTQPSPLDPAANKLEDFR